MATRRWQRDIDLMDAARRAASAPKMGMRHELAHLWEVKDLMIARGLASETGSTLTPAELLDHGRAFHAGESPTAFIDRVAVARGVTQ